MPDADGNLRPIRVPDLPKCFCGRMALKEHRCEAHLKCNTIAFTPDWSLDGVTFTPECECVDRCSDPRRDDCKNPKQ